MNSVKKWVFENKYFIKSGNKNKNKIKPTHYLLDGGIWNIPMSEYNTFLKKLANGLTNGEKHYISENKTDIFKFICDLDFYDSKIVSLDYLNEIIKIIESIISEYYGTQKIIICSTDSKECKVNGITTTKTGFHLVWSKLWITKETALFLRNLFVKELTYKLGQRNENNTWEDVVDGAIYDQNGLRMIGCRKISKCKNCLLKECTFCDGSGKIDEGRVYKPIKIINSNDQEYFNAVTKDYYVMLLETSIINYSMLPETKSIKEITVNDITKNIITKNITKSIITKKIDGIMETKIENFIKKNFDSKYQFSIKKVTKLNDELIIIEPTVNYCSNVGRHHSSSNTYFQIKRSGICQRCFCKKAINNCSKYCSKEVPLSIPLKKILFGDLTKKISNFNLKNNTNNNYTPITQNNKILTIKNCKIFLQQLESELQ